MYIGSAVKEHTEKSVECRTSSSNPATLVNMEFFIDGTKQTDIKPKVTEAPGSNNGIVKTFVYRFTTNRSQNGNSVKCSLHWNRIYINKTEVKLNITCK